MGSPNPQPCHYGQSVVLNPHLHYSQKAQCCLYGQNNFSEYRRIFAMACVIRNIGKTEKELLSYVSDLLNYGSPLSRRPDDWCQSCNDGRAKVPVDWVARVEQSQIRTFWPFLTAAALVRHHITWRSERMLTERQMTCRSTIAQPMRVSHFGPVFQCPFASRWRCFVHKLTCTVTYPWTMWENRKGMFIMQYIILL